MSIVELQGNNPVIQSFENFLPSDEVDLCIRMYYNMELLGWNCLNLVSYENIDWSQFHPTFAQLCHALIPAFDDLNLEI